MINFFLRYSDLIFTLSLRELKVKYKQAILGVLWAVIQPVFRIIVFTFIFFKISKIQYHDVPYPIFVYSGLVFWSFFLSSIDNSMFSLVNNLDLVTKIYFPRIILPISSILALFVDFIINILILFCMLFYYKIKISFIFVFLVIPFIIQMIFSFGISFLFSAINVFYRDVRYVISLVFEIIIFLTPVVYPLDVVPEKYIQYIKLNPLTNIFQSYREIIFSGTINLSYLVYPFIISCVIFYLGYSYFIRVEKDFADVL